MGKEYKRRNKELLGKPAVRGYDVLSVGVGSLSGVVGHSTLATAGGTNRFVSPEAGLLDFLVVNVSPALTAGTLSVALHQNGSLVHSGVLNSAVPAVTSKFWHTEDNSEVALASGDVLQVHYAVGSALSPGVTDYEVNARVGLRYRKS